MEPPLVCVLPAVGPDRLRATAGGRRVEAQEGRVPQVRRGGSSPPRVGGRGGGRAGKAGGEVDEVGGGGVQASAHEEAQVDEA